MIVLPFPPASLSGHNTGHWRGKSPIVKQLRQHAHDVTWDAKPTIPLKGDIRIHIRFVPPSKRGDRVNFPIRIKPLIDGIADALQVNDSRFLPSYEFAEPEKPGRVEVLFPRGYRQVGVPYAPVSDPVNGLPPRTEAA